MQKAKGKIDSISEYEPADLFSSDAAAKEKALRALVASPQNNFCAYKNARQVFPSPPPQAAACEAGAP